MPFASRPPLQPEFLEHYTPIEVRGSRLRIQLQGSISRRKRTRQIGSAPRPIRDHTTSSRKITPQRTIFRSNSCRTLEATNRGFGIARQEPRHAAHS
jgi:hypothetical protein